MKIRTLKKEFPARARAMRRSYRIARSLAGIKEPSRADLVRFFEAMKNSAVVFMAELMLEKLLLQFHEQKAS